VTLYKISESDIILTFIDCVWLHLLNNFFHLSLVLQFINFIQVINFFNPGYDEFIRPGCRIVRLLACFGDMFDFKLLLLVEVQHVDVGFEAVITFLERDSEWLVN